MKALCLTLLISTLAVAQPKAGVTGTGSFTTFVEDMDRTLAFYHDAFGMEVPALPATGARPYNQANPQLFKFFDIPGAKERHQSARIPNTRVTVEIMEIQQVPFQTHALRIQDPGAVTLVFIVRDIDAVLAKALQAKAVVATPGGKPVAFPGGSRSILVRDNDGRFIELRQPATPPAGTTDILDMRLSLAVNDLAATILAYRDVLGFTVGSETQKAADTATRNLTGLAQVEIRRAPIQAPGSQLWIELAEYRNVDRKPLVMKIQDRGAARLQLRVQDTDVAAAAAKTGGLKIMSTDGIAQPIPPNFKGVLIADPNYFFLTPFAPCDGCAPTIGGGPAKGK